MKCICRFGDRRSDNSNFDDMLYKALPVNKSVLPDTVNIHLSEVIQHIPGLNQSKLDIYRNNFPQCRQNILLTLQTYKKDSGLPKT